MHRHKFLRHAAAVLAAAALLAAVVLAGLAAALPDTLYTDGPAAELEIASMPYLTVKKRQGSVAADSTTPDTSANVTLTLFGGIISGVGSGLAIRYGGAMDGIEVVAVIFAKPLGLSVGTFVLIYNVLLYMICGIVMGSWILPLYSIVTYAAGSKTVDFIVDGLDSAKAAMIITTHPDEIARAVSEEFGTGLTIIDAHGFYSDTPKTVLYVVVNRFQTVKLKTLVKGVDTNAYMAISPVADLLHGSKEEETA